MKKLSLQIFMTILILFSLIITLQAMDETSERTTLQLQQDLIDAFKHQGLRHKQAKKYVGQIRDLLKELTKILTNPSQLDLDWTVLNWVVAESNEYETRKIAIKTIFFEGLPPLATSFATDCLKRMAEEVFNTKYDEEFMEQPEPPSIKRIKKFIFKTLIALINSYQELFRFPPSNSNSDVNALESSAHEENSPEAQTPPTIQARDPDNQDFVLLPPPHHLAEKK